MPNVKVFFDGQEIDLVSPDQLSIQVTYSIDENNVTGNTLGSKAYSFKAPGTATNRQIFNLLDVRGVDSEENLNLKTARIEVDGVDILKGKGKVSKSSFKGSETPMYSVKMWGDNSDWIIDIQGKKIREVDFGAFNFSIANIKATWKNTIPTGASIYDADELVAFPLVDLGQWASAPDVKAEDLRPGLFIYPLVMRIFKNVGYTVKSDFFETDYFRRLIIYACKNFHHSNTAIEDFRVEAENTAEKLPNTSPVSGPTYQDNVYFTFDDELNDPNSEISPQTSAFWANPTRYQPKANQTVDIEIEVQFIKVYNGVANNILFELRQGIEGTILHSSTYPGKASPGLKVFKVNVEGLDVTTIDNILFKLHCEDDSGAGQIFKLGVGCNLNIKHRKPVRLGHNFNIVQSAIPGDLMQGSLIKGLIQMFNLHLETDIFRKEVRIEPFDSFFGEEPGVWDEWGKQINKSRLQEFGFRDQISRVVKIGFKTDSGDAYVDRLEEENDASLYSIKFNFPDRFKAGIDPKENIFFAATHHIKQEALATVGNPTVIIPRIWEEVQDFGLDYPGEGDPDFKQASSFEPRILFYYDAPEEEGVFDFEGVQIKHYPRAYQIPYEDSGLNAFSPLETVSFADWENETGTILRGLFWKHFLSDFATKRGAKYYSAYFLLNVPMIAQLTFRTLKGIEGNSYRLLSVNNYSPNKTESTRAILLERKYPDQEDKNSIEHSQTDGIKTF